MNPVWLFIGALAALHVIEGFLWVRRDALAFAATWRGHDWYKPGGPLGTGREVLIPLSPFPPLAETFVVEPWPLTMTAQRVWLVPAQRLGEPTAPPAEAPSWTWQEAARARRDGRTIEGPRRLSVRASSAALAEHLVRALREAAALKEKKRARFLDELLADAHRPEAITARIEAFKAAAWRLRLYGNVLLPALFFGAYGFFFVDLVNLNWPILVGVLLVLLAVIWGETWWAHRRLFPELRGDRWTALVMMVLSPPAGIRAYGWLARDILAPFHPLAVGAALLPEDRLRALASAAWRDLSHPLGPEDPAARAGLDEPRRALKAALRRALQARDVEVEGFDVPPAATEPGVVAYCPRCRELFRSVDGDCSDCPGVARRPLPTDAVGADEQGADRAAAAPTTDSVGAA